MNFRLKFSHLLTRLTLIGATTGLLVGQFHCQKTKIDKKSTGQHQTPATANCLRIVGGEITEAFSSTVLLVHDNLSESCTGVFVGPNTLLTAAHCIDKSDPLNVAYVVGAKVIDLKKSMTEQVQNRIKPQKVVTLDDAPVGQPGPYPISSLAQTVRKDLAVLIFDKEVAPAVSSLIKTALSPDGAEVTLVGFGVSKTAVDDNEVRKRSGTNKTGLLPVIPTASWQGHIALFGPANPDGGSGAARADHGDSGGPLFSQNFVAGIFSHIYYSQDIRSQNGPLADFLGSRVLSSYADVTSSDAALLFDKAKKLGATFVNTPDRAADSVSQSANVTPATATSDCPN